MTKLIQFTKDDIERAIFGVLPSFLLIATGNLTLGIAFALGLLPTSMLGVAPTRKKRIIFGLIGSLFGVGIALGSFIANINGPLTASAIFIVICYFATIAASKRPAGGLLLSLIIPSLAVGTGYGQTEALALMLAFIGGSLWSAIVTLHKPEFKPDKASAAKLQALQPKSPRIYGLMLGLAVSTALIVGYLFDIPYAGWIATAAMLIMRPLQQMTGWRSFGRIVSTITGTILAVMSISLGLGYLATAIAACFIAVIIIGARTSRLYITSFGTAFLILTIELYGVTNTEDIHYAGWWRIADNVIGALIAIIFGLLVPYAIDFIAKRWTVR